MVLSAKSGEDTRNGRRSRGPSPNGHAQPESSEDESSVPVDKIRVGRDYQAVCPELIPEPLRKPELLADRALLVWSPTADIQDIKLEDYIILAKEKYGYNGEQALGMLFWHKHDLDRAVLDLANFTPFPDEWSVEDKVLFEQAFQFHGKSFHRIRQMLPDKSIASLVKYYYSWKKTRSRTSLMDKQAKKLSTPREDGAPSEAGSEGGSNEESDHEEKKWNVHRGIRRSSGSPPRAKSNDENGKQGEGGACSNCGVNCTVTHTTPKGTMCTSCFQHWRRTGTLRPTSGPTGGKRGAIPLGVRHKRKPPRGMCINHDDLAAFATGNAGELILKAAEREVESLQRQIQQNKQVVSSLKRKHSDSIEDLRPSKENSSSRINSRWTNEEQLLAVQSVKKYGKDFKSIADILGNKTEHHVRSFFLTNRKKYELDDALKEYEKDNGTTVNEEETVANSNATATANSTTSETDKVIELLDDPSENGDVICVSPPITTMTMMTTTTPSPTSKKDVIVNNKSGTATPKMIPTPIMQNAK